MVIRETNGVRDIIECRSTYLHINIRQSNITTIAASFSIISITIISIINITPSIL